MGQQGNLVIWFCRTFLPRSWINDCFSEQSLWGREARTDPLAHASYWSKQLVSSSRSVLQHLVQLCVSGAAPGWELMCTADVPAGAGRLYRWEAGPSHITGLCSSSRGRAKWPKAQQARPRGSETSPAKWLKSPSLSLPFYPYEVTFSTFKLLFKIFYFFHSALHLFVCFINFYFIFEHSWLTMLY